MRPITKITILGTRLGVIALIAYWILIFVGTHVPVLPDAAPKINDKVMHFCAYFGLTLILCYVSKPAPRPKRFGRIAALALSYGVLDEFTQSFVRGRDPDVYDFLADASGIATSILLYVLAQVVYAQFKKTRPASRAT